MNIVQPYTKMLSPAIGYAILDANGVPSLVCDKEFTPEDGIALLRRIEYACRISHRSEESITPDSWKRIIGTVVLEKGDLSVIEHEKVSVEADIDRGIQTEWVRHRLMSYTFESTRFVNYVKKMAARFIQPKFTAEQANSGALTVWTTAIEAAEGEYQFLVKIGVAPQIARSVFPLALAGKGLITANLRSWRHFFIMRTTKEAHPQMKEVTIPLLLKFQATIPLLFDDIVPEQRQADAMRLLR